MIRDCIKLAQDFQEYGFLIIENFFTPLKIAEIQAAVERYIKRVHSEDSFGCVVYEPGSERKIRNLFDMQHDDDYFADLMRTPELIELVTVIFDDTPVSVNVELFGKPARVGSVVPHHQDNAYFNLTPDDALTCWIALADATEENGCVRYIEGSHQLGNLPHEASGVKGNSMRLKKLPTGAGREVSGIVRRGGALIHHCNTIHRSEPNRSDKDRPGLLFVYKAARCRVDRTRAEKYEAISAAVM